MQSTIIKVNEYTEINLNGLTSFKLQTTGACFVYVGNDLPVNDNNSVSLSAYNFFTYSNLQASEKLYIKSKEQEATVTIFSYSAPSGGGVAEQVGGFMVYGNNAITNETPLKILQNNTEEINISDLVPLDSNALMPDDIQELTDGYLDKGNNGVKIGSVIGRMNEFTLELEVTTSTSNARVFLRGQAIEDASTFNITGNNQEIKREVETRANPDTGLDEEVIIYQPINIIVKGANSDYFVNNVNTIKLFIKADDGDVIIGSMNLVCQSNNVKRPATI